MIKEQIKGNYMSIKKNAVIRYALFFGFAFLAFQFHGCDTNNTNDATLSLSFNSAQGLNKVTVGAVELDTVKILIRDMKLENESESDHHSGMNHEMRSEDIKVGPFVVYLNLNGITTDFAVNSIPAGFYNEIKFKIHQIQGSELPPDPEFKEGEDNSLRYSVIVKGKYNNVPFVYKSRKSAHQKVELDTPLEVVENTSTNLTITVDPYSWFMDGQTEIDPTNSANMNLIDNNIAKSFKGACRDDDHNGKHD